MGGSSIVEERGGMAFFFFSLFLPKFQQIAMPGVEADSQRGQDGKLFYSVQDSSKPWIENTAEPH